MAQLNAKLLKISFKFLEQKFQVFIRNYCVLHEYPALYFDPSFHRTGLLPAVAALLPPGSAWIHPDTRCSAKIGTDQGGNLPAGTKIRFVKHFPDFPKCLSYLLS